MLFVDGDNTMFDVPSYAALRQVSALIGLTVKIIPRNDPFPVSSFIALPPVTIDAPKAGELPEAISRRIREARRLVSATNFFLLYSFGLEKTRECPILGVTSVGTLWDFAAACDNVPPPLAEHALSAIRQSTLFEDARRIYHDLRANDSTSLRVEAVDCLHEVGNQFPRFTAALGLTATSSRDSLLSALDKAKAVLSPED